ncbi:MAG: hypothetical protein KAS53_07560 [Candidatus Cloacimonetes bacterium]|nr:hypothetical protein [Candidatus Cloacimonadota bacterium]
MKKKKIKTLIIIIMGLLVSSLWAERSNFQIIFTAGRSIIYTEDNPKSYYYDKIFYKSPNYGIIVKWKNQCVEFNYKKFDNNPIALELDINDDITGKDFLVFALKYGREIYSFKNFNLTAFAGVGFIQRKTNQDKAGPAKSTFDKFITLPIKLTLNKMIYKKIGLSASMFSDLNFEETISGLEINLLIQVK